MKPSERRALEAEKRARAEAEARERELTREREDSYAYAQAPVEEPDSPPQNDTSTPMAEEVKYKRKEGFFQSHVRLITFIITTALVVFVLGPLGIDMLVAARNDKTVQNKEDMSMSAVYSVHDSAELIEWKHFSKFNYTDYSGDYKTGNYRIREYPIKGSSLMLKVGGPEIKNRPDYVYLIDYETGEYIDVLLDDPREFVKSKEQE